MSVRLQLLGTPAIECGGISTALPFERRGQLVALLALRRGWMARTEIAAMLWPEQEAKLAFSNLRKSLFRLQSLPWGGNLESQGGSLRFVADTDVLAFEQALREQRPADALAIHRGALLAGFDDDANEAWTGWLQFERSRLNAAWRGAALAHLSTDGDTAAGIDLSARLLESDPLDEGALRAHMTLLARAGQTGRARQVYRKFVAQLADELGIEPGAELQVLSETLNRAAAVSTVPPLARRPASVDEEGFVGRSAELRWIAETMARDDVRLLCLAGPGGIGKTRLARRVLLDLAPTFARGGVFVPLEDVGAAGELVDRIARETGVALHGRSRPIEQLCAGLSGRTLLLVLDNFEHLVGDASLLDELLAGCPDLKMLVTSRVRLGLAGEHLLPLEGLPTPESEDEDRIDAFDAVRLFVAAARRVEPAFVPSAEASAIIDICRQVDGMPLALELAAAWARVLSCETIAAELRAGTDLLRSTDATRAPRHASIEQVFEQSWRRLVSAERDALARMAVFQGGFGAEAARAVAAAPLPVLGALADKSLLRKDGARLSLHPLVQQLAAAQLDDEARTATRAAHAEYFVRLMAQLNDSCANGDRAALLLLDTELENCRLAFDWVVDRGTAESVWGIASTLQLYFDHRGRFEAGLTLLRKALDAPSVQGNRTMQARLLAEVAQFHYRLDRYADSQAMATRSLAAAGRAAPRAVRIRALNVLGACALRAERLDDAREHFQQVLSLATADDRLNDVAATLDHLALVEKRLGRFDEALALSLKSLAEHRRIGDSAGVALCLNNLASLYRARDDEDAAAAHLREALLICERDGLQATRGYVLANLAEVTMKAGELDASTGHAARAVEVAELTGNRVLMAWMKTHLARLAVHHHDLGTAHVTLGGGAEVAMSLGIPAVQIAALACFAELLFAHGEAAGARSLLAFAIDHPITNGPDRNELRSQLEQWGEQPQATWPGLGLDELMHRIVVEAELAHAPLRALLLGRPAPPST
jgi:predicted ATPase/DNA-binding SARP family transcriptional activator